MAEYKIVAYLSGVEEALPVEFDNPIIAEEMIGREAKAWIHCEDATLQLTIKEFDNPIIARVRLTDVPKYESVLEPYQKSDVARVYFKVRGDFLGLHVEPVITE